LSTLYLDTETRSPTPIDVGVFRYSESVEILLVSFALDSDPVIVWEWGDANWSERTALHLQELIDSVDTVVMHNAEFDRTVLGVNHVDVPLEKSYCTMAQARRHGLPGGLEKLCEIFKLGADVAKMKDSKKLIRLFCIPNKDGTWNTKETHPVEWVRFVEYARLDVESMRALHPKMPTWNDEIERPIWELDQRTNARGFCVDADFAWHATQLLGESKEDTDGKLARTTQGKVTKGTQRDRILRYLLAEHGVDLPDLTASTLDRRLNDPALPDAVRELIGLRLESAKTSNSKYATLLKCLSSDGRLRGSLVYCGAGRTGRWSGAKFQPHNLPRPTLPPEEIQFGIDAIKSGVVDLIGTEPLSVYASQGLRGVVVAAPGYRLLVSDLANIEGRVVAWLAGEEWKLDAFRAYDGGTGPDLYRVAYAAAFGIADSRAVSGLERQVGKVMELMLGFGGGVGAFITGADTYHVDLELMAQKAWPAIPRGDQIDAEIAFVEALVDDRTFGLSPEVYMTCHALSRLWRKRHPEIRSYWYDMEDAARHTIVTGEERDCRGVYFSKFDAWLRMHLPSGRLLCYPSPKVSPAGEITFMGQSPYSRTWARQKTWGGTLVENATQATASDVLRFGMLRADAIGLPIVLHVHDEILCESQPDLGEDGVDQLVECMSEGEDWTDGLPLAAKGFETDRYRKAD
jgi:DNA polymerase bacteriophage-type